MTTVASFIGQALLGWIIADLVGGLVHWLEDRVFTEHTPLMREVVRDNDLHHAEPMAFVAGTFMSRNAATAALSFALAALWWLAFGPSVMLIFATIGGVVSNEVHCLAHARRGTVTRVLQDMGVFQSPVVHARHHRPPQNSHFCSLTNWCNPILDALDVWGRIERLFGIRPRA